MSSNKYFSLIFLLMILSFSLVACQQPAYLKINYLQAHHTEVDYFTENDKLMVNNVYCDRYHGSSMNPILFDGNIVCFKEYKGEELRQGNVIHYVSTTYRMEGVHRIIAIQSPDSVIVQGDNNLVQEEINTSQIRGILVATLYK